MQSGRLISKMIWRISRVVVILAALLSATGPIGKAGALDASSLAVFTQLDFYANIETIGVLVSGSSLPQRAELKYRQSGAAIWQSGHSLMRMDDDRLAGSLFGLSPATSYDIKVLEGSTEISGSVTTQAEELQFTPSVVLHVNDDAPSGGDGSAAAPFKNIQDGINRAGPGTQVLVADGTYHEAVSFPASGTAGNWIQVKAEGSAAILEGSQNLAGNIWTTYPSASHVWFTKIGASIAYLARDGKRFYMYDDRSGLMQSRGHSGVPMNEGWYFEPSTLRLYVRSVDNPASHTWQVPYLNHAFDVVGRDWLWIEGFEIRFYGTNTNGCGVCTINASHVVVRRNKIHNMQLGVFINWNGGESQGNDTRIEYNEIYDPPVNEWPWKAVKGSSMEGTGIVVRGHIGAIVRSNEVHNYFNGIYTGSSAALAIENPAVAFDADIYNNHIHHISDDGLEPEGACVNQRFRNNTVDAMLVGISLAPITQGPTWVLRSSFTNYSGSSIKWDRNSDGLVMMYHNTSWTNANNPNAMGLISPVHNAVLRNNIFQSNGYAFEEVPTGSTGNDWNNDNWYTTRALGTPHFKWESVDYSTISALCAATGLECNGYEAVPGLTNPGGGDFTLLSSSPNIDRGAVIPGINDGFSGNAPDVGAYEFEFAFDPPPSVSASVRANTNPTDAATVNFTVTFSESVTGVDILPPFNDFGLTASAGITGASITSVGPVSGTTYTVNVNTGSGNGTIRLDVIDDDSIMDSAHQPLGGAGVGNGNFTTGEVYTIDKTSSLPAAATLSSPGGGIGTNYTPTYTWNKVNNATWYYLWVNGPSGNVIKQWYEAPVVCGLSTCSVTPATNLSAGDHTWWIQTWNPVGYGPWSSGMNFTAAPGATALVSPSGAIGGTTPTYTWNKVTGATWYYLWVSKLNNDGSLTTVHTKWYDASAVCGSSTCSITPNVTLVGGNYRWWIQTWNNGGYGSWSSRMDFSLEIIAPPGLALLVSPTGVTTDTTPAYTWGKVNTATWYYLWVSQVNNDGSLTTVHSKWYDASLVCSDANCSFGPDLTLSSGNYRWWIQTWNDGGYGPWSTRMDFSLP